jgi:tetratricopeptide (TPR) repeat protein
VSSINQKRETPSQRRYLFAIMLAGALCFDFDMGPSLFFDFGFLKSARARASFPQAPSGRDIVSWDAAEGLYERDGNLIVVARYDEKTRSPNSDQNIGLLLLRIGSLMQAYVTGPIDAKDRLSQTIISTALERSDILPKSNREVARQFGPSQGRLVLEFIGGVEILKKGRAQFELTDLSAIAQELKTAALLKPDPALLRLFAVRNGEVLDEIRIAAENLEPSKLITLIPRSTDPLIDRDALLQLYCNEPKCALRSEAHLALAKSLSTPPAAAAVHGLLARWTSDPKIRHETDAVLKGIWSGDRAHREFYQLLKKCETLTNANSLSGLIIEHCGIFWPTPSRHNADSVFSQAEASFKEGSDPNVTMTLLMQVVDQDPGNARAWSYLGSIFVYLKKDEAALAAFQQSVLRNPSSLDARLNLADSYKKLGAPILAKATYNDILARVAAGQNAEFTKNIKGEVISRLNVVSQSSLKGD